MAPFVLYLLETGICLSMLYLAWWLFLRKETYFGFNRLYLVGCIALALLVPVLHLHLDIPLDSALEKPARGVSQVRDGYGELIALLDADYGREPGEGHSMGSRPGIPGLADERDFGDEWGVSAREGQHFEHGDSNLVAEEGIRRELRIHLSRILFIIYIGGVLYFLARFAFLLVRLRLLTKRNRVQRQREVRVVEIGEDIAPFSFFRFLFINTGIFTDSELQQVLEHEKAHIRQRHSVDHLFAHAFAVFQWFNPLAWQVRKALKTTHEYIADRHVLSKGIERNDYQALLLRQVVGYHSVELVNNFNLNPIKKRIAMMNKNKSGIPARLRAVLVIPASILVFFFFAEFTMKSAAANAEVAGPDLSGLWINQSEDGFYKALHIQGGTLSSLHSLRGMEVESQALKVNGDYLVLSEDHLMPGVSLKYDLKGEELLIWLNDARPENYKKSSADNTLDHLLSEWQVQPDLPVLSQYRLLEREELLYRINMGTGSGGKALLAFNGEPFALTELEGLLQKMKRGLSKLDHAAIIGVFLVDKGTPMSRVNQVRDELRRTGNLHFAEGGYPHPNWGTYPLLYDRVALPRALPPLEAKTMDKEEVKKSGIPLCTIDLGARNSSPADVYQLLTSFIGEADGRYVISLEYDKDTPYGEYVEVVDMIWKRVYAFRNSLAMEKYNVDYDKLGPEIQREIRQAYPMALSETLQ